MTHLILSISPKPAAHGGIDGYEAVCSCGYRMASVFEAQAARDGNDHVACMTATTKPSRLTNEAIHSALGIASRHNPDADRWG